MPPKKVYTKKDPISHILERSDMYVGSKKLRNIEEYISIKDEEDNYKIVKKEINSSPAILRIFVEVLSNAIDNVERSKKAKIPCTTIKVVIDKETGETSVWNDGDIIPIELNEEEKIYNHSLIFGNLLTGSNYNDEEERLISGRNGLGSKLTNVFSTKFIVKGLDPCNQKVLEQTWTNNMRETSEPKITDTKLIKGFTKVTYFPDFKQLGLKGYTKDIVNLYSKYVIDAAMLTKVKVYLNDELIPANDLISYSKLYDSATNENILLKYSGSEVLITPSDINEFQTISFVNGVYTRLGGVHVDSWSETVLRPIVEKFNKKDKTPQITIKDVKQFFRFFIVSTVVNPEFSSQDKEKLEAPKIQSSIKSTEINKILKWSVIGELEDIIKLKEMSVLKKSEKKKKGYTKIEGMDNANNAGGKLGYQCSLILCEGLSAKTYAVAGIQKGVYDKKGRDFFGCLPLRGKLLNCRNTALATIAKNKVITDLIQALGLRYDLDYKEDKNYKTLSYGKVILLTDSDVDGAHISGLIMNFFHALFPTLLEREDPYVVSMATPIVRVFNKGGDILFYDENRFRKFQDEQTKSFKSKYYKGLGSTKPEDVPDTFGMKMIEYKIDINTNKNMNKVFHKKFADTRKEWLENYDPNSNFSLDDQGELVDMNISNFLNNEVIKFSHNDCKRSIPSLFDGLKQSQRKVLFAVKKRGLTSNKPTLKVAQLGGYVAEHTNYHHGEQNLFDTIVNMAHDFVGSNNIPLLERDGMFGCVDPETDILLWSGHIIKAKYIKIGDELIGDDGQKRIVNKTVSGMDKMYEIIQESGNNYIVNSQHILTLYFSENKKISWHSNSNSWRSTFYDIKSKSFITKSITSNYVNKQINKKNINTKDNDTQTLYINIINNKKNPYILDVSNYEDVKNMFNYLNDKYNCNLTLITSEEEYNNQQISPSNKKITFKNIENIIFNTTVRTVKRGHSRGLTKNEISIINKYKNPKGIISVKLNFKLAEEIRKKYTYKNYSTLAKEYNVSVSTIKRIIKNKIWTKEFDSYETYNKSKYTKEEAFNILVENLKDIPDEKIIDINIQDYLKIPKYIKNSLRGISNHVNIEWDKKEVPIDPYIFGMWLGDGDKDGGGFTSADDILVKEWVKWGNIFGLSVTHTKNGKDHENYHYTLRRKINSSKSKYLPIGHSKHSCDECIGCLTSLKENKACDWIYEDYIDEDVICEGFYSNGTKRNDLNKFVKILKENNLYKNKHIPENYIFNDEETRLKLLAGLIDTDGTIKDNGEDTVQRIEISQCNITHGNIIDKAEYICKSLGFKTSVSIYERITKNNKPSIMKKLSIYGDGLYKIPTKLKHKILKNIKRKKNIIGTKMKIKEVNYGKYVGWYIDKNERFLLGDFTITHNTRLSMGKDSASPRYIFTRMESITPYIFREEDDVLLEYVIDDGDYVEPKFYIPIIPMILVNGCEGIGTGWSSSVPAYNPLDIIECIKVWLDNDGEVIFNDPDDGTVLSMLPEIKPWYRGFTGRIEESQKKYISYGVIEKNKDKIKVTELPIGMSTDKFKEKCEDWLVEKQIKSCKFYSTPDKVDFSITESDDGFSCNINNMGLYSYIHTTNMVMFNEKEQLRKYDVDDIINSFCIIRYEYYAKRKKYIINSLEKDLKYIGNKARFIQEIIEKKLNIMNIDEEVVIKELEKRGYDREIKKESDEEGGYNYLLSLHVRTFTANKIKQLNNDIANIKDKLGNIKATSEKQIWLNDLKEFENEYEKWLKKMEEQKNKINKKKK